jgi:hypothetical protein
MLTKIVNGVEVVCSDEEEALRLAEDADWAAGQAARQAEAIRLAGVDVAIAADSTIAQLKAMTSAEFDTWWSANVTTAAQAINVLKRVTRVVLRRVL